MPCSASWSPTSTRVAQVATRGLEPARWETFEGTVRKATFVDPDGNEFGFGDATQE